MDYSKLTLPDLLRKVASELRTAAARNRDLNEKVAMYEDQSELAKLAAALKGTLDDPDKALDALKKDGHDLNTIKAAAALVGSGTPDGNIFKLAKESAAATDSTAEFLRLVE